MRVRAATACSTRCCVLRSRSLVSPVSMDRVTVMVIYVLRCVAVSCNVLQCVATCNSSCCGWTSRFLVSPISMVICMLRCVAVCCGVLQCVAVCCSVLQCVAARGCLRIMQYSLLHFEKSFSCQPCSNCTMCVAARCSVMRCVAVRCSVLQCVAVRGCVRIL